MVVAAVVVVEEMWRPDGADEMNQSVFIRNAVCLLGSSADAGILSEGGFVTSLPGQETDGAARGPPQSLRPPGGAKCGSLALLRHAKEAMQCCLLLLLLLLFPTGQSNRFAWLRCGAFLVGLSRLDLLQMRTLFISLHPSQRFSFLPSHQVGWM